MSNNKIEDQLTGYQSKGYIKSYYQDSDMVYLANADGWLGKRLINHNGECDLSGGYPMAFFNNLPCIEQDFRPLVKQGFISMTFVTNQINNLTVNKLSQKVDLFKPFKKHYLATLEKPWENVVRRTMKKNALRAFKLFDVSPVDSLYNSDYAETLWRLHQKSLAGKHISIDYPINFNVLKEQLNMPGIKLFKGEYNNKIHGIACYIEVADKVYGHVIGSTQFGLNNHLNYGLYAVALKYYHKQKAFIDFGGNAGLVNDSSCGLSKFKSGWSSHVANTYICGKILNSNKYQQLIGERFKNSKYFPAYRDPQINAYLQS